MIKKGLKKYIPDNYYPTIYDVDFSLYYNQGKRLLFLDIDNTVVKYTEKDANMKVQNLLKEIKEIGFEIIVISNNYKKRIKRFCKPFNIKYVYSALKPLRTGYKKGLKMASRKYDKNEIIAIGDQLMTDIKGANKMGFYTILVTPLERKTDVITTKINRFFERRRIRQVKNKYPELYETKLRQYEEM